MLDLLENPGFSLTSLTASIQDAAHVPGRIGSLGLFQSEGVTTTTVQVEKLGDTLSLVKAGVRGGQGQTNPKDKRQLIPFNTIHLPQDDGVTADEAQNARAFGSEDAVQTVLGLVEQRLATMRRNIDATLEYHRIGAIKGQILDADGTTVLEDVNSRFGITQDEMDIVLSDSATKLQARVLEILNKLEDNLGGLAFTNVRVFCGRNFFKELVENPKMKAAFDRDWETDRTISISS